MFLLARPSLPPVERAGGGVLRLYIGRTRQPPVFLKKPCGAFEPCGRTGRVGRESSSARHRHRGGGLTGAPCASWLRRPVIGTAPSRVTRVRTLRVRPPGQRRLSEAPPPQLSGDSRRAGGTAGWRSESRVFDGRRRSVSTGRLLIGPKPHGRDQSRPPREPPARSPRPSD